MNFYILDDNFNDLLRGRKPSLNLFYEIHNKYVSLFDAEDIFQIRG